MALSKLYTVNDVWREASLDIPKEQSIAHWEKFNLINRAQQSVQAEFAPLVAESYITETTAVFSTTGKYGTTGTYTVATKTLVATMNTGFVSADIGNTIILRTGTTVYMGTIASRVSGTTVTLSGDNLPSIDQSSFDTITVAGTSPTGNVIDISSLRLLRYGNQLNIQLLSTATKFIYPKTKEDIERFRPTSQYSLDKIWWMMIGNKIYLVKGNSLSTYGTLTIRYPALPDQVALVTDYVDVLDGAMVQILIKTVRGMILRRLGEKPSQADEVEIQKNIANLYTSLQQELTIEQLKEKSEKLL